MPLQPDEILKTQELDLRIDALTREKAALDNGAGLKQQVDQVFTSLADAEARRHRAEAEQLSAELELKTVEEKKATVHKKLYEGRIVIPKELTAMEQEIEMFGRQRSHLDERIL